MTQEEYWHSRNNADRNNADRQHEAAMNSLVIEQEFKLVSMIHPKIFIDGNKWCVLYGENLQDGVCGFGNSPTEAIYDFNKSFDKSLKQSA